MANPDTATAETPSLPPAPLWQRALPWLALLAAGAFFLLLGARPIHSIDLGYHLRYGYAGPVDHCPYIYTLPASEAPAAQRPEPGPGCWYDSDGRYRFANANWGTQVLLAGVHARAGWPGLWAFRMGLIAALAALLVAWCRRLGLGPAATAAVLLLVGLAAYERLSLRPELLGYVLLVAQALVLSGRPLRWRHAAMAIALQLLLVNVHSYFMLGLAVTGCFVIDRLLTWRLESASGASGAAERAAKARGELNLLAVILAGQAAAAFVNPWTWRLAVLPIQTLLYLRSEGVGSGTDAGPWGRIGEFLQPLLPGAFAGRKATYAYYALLALAGLGALAAALRKKWWALLLVVGLAVVSTSMRRNIAVAAMLIAPVAVACLVRWVRALLRRGSAETGAPAGERPAWAAGALALACGAVLSGLVVSGQFYYSERMPVWLGAGTSRLLLTVDLSAWMNRHLPPRPAEGQAVVTPARPERIWCDYNVSSDFHFRRWQAAPRTEISVLTNTWAYPPAVLGEVQAVCGLPPGQADAPPTAAYRQDVYDRFQQAAGRYGIDAVVLRVDRSTAPLGRALTESDGWKLVYVDVAHAVFLPADGGRWRPNDPPELTEPLLLAQMPQRVEAVAALGPFPALAHHLQGYTLQRLGLPAAAEWAYQAALAADDGLAEAWNQLGLCRVDQARKKLNAGNAAVAIRSWRRAERAFAGALELLESARAAFRSAFSAEPGHSASSRNLRRVDWQIQQVRDGLKKLRAGVVPR